MAGDLRCACEAGRQRHGQRRSGGGGGSQELTLRPGTAGPAAGLLSRLLVAACPACCRLLEGAQRPAGAVRPLANRPGGDWRMKRHSGRVPPPNSALGAKAERGGEHRFPVAQRLPCRSASTAHRLRIQFGARSEALAPRGLLHCRHWRFTAFPSPALYCKRLQQTAAHRSSAAAL